VLTKTWSGAGRFQLARFSMRLIAAAPSTAAETATFCCSKANSLRPVVAFVVAAYLCMLAFASLATFLEVFALL